MWFIMSFLKKLIKKKDEEQRPNAGPPPTGVQTMSAELQLKYAKGVQYNSKCCLYYIDARPDLNILSN